jgi:DNA polymerase-3 subunit alpha
MNIRTRQTKRGDRIGIFSLDDGTTHIEVVCFSEAYLKFRSLIVEDQMIIVDGEVGMDDFSNSPRIVARDLHTIEQARERYAKHLRIHLTSTQSIDAQNLKKLLGRHIGGSCSVIVRYLYDNIQADIRLGKNCLIKPSNALLTQIQEEFSIENIEFVY